MVSASESEKSAKTNTSVSKPVKSLLKTTSTVAVITSISRVLGFLRDLVIAHFFGAGAAVDAFLVAFKIPNFLRRLFAEGAFSQAFVPVLAHYREENQKEAAQQFIHRVYTALAFVLFWVVCLGVLLAPVFIFIFAPGFEHDPYRYNLASTLLRITFPYLFFISLTAFASAILNSYERFGIAAFTPVLLNISMILTSFLIRNLFTEPIYSLALGVILGGILQLIFQYPYLKRLNLAPIFLWRQISDCYHHDGVRHVLKLMVPALFGVSVAQVNLLVDTLFASFLATGSVSWLYFSDRMIEFPLGVFGVALATVSLPRLSRYVAQGAFTDFNRTLDWGIRTTLLISLPAGLGLGILALPILSSLFQYGVFDAHAALMTAKSLTAFAFGLPAFMVVKILASAFYSHQNIKTPVRIGVIAMIVNMVLNVILIWHFAHQGLALSTSLAAYVNVILLLIILKKKQLFSFQYGWGKFLLQVLAANLILSISLFWLCPPVEFWLNGSWYSRAKELLLLMFVSGLSYFATLVFTGFDWKHLRHS
jgi:putative peptidoglycan lipid II flippase